MLWAVTRRLHTLTTGVEKVWRITRKGQKMLHGSRGLRLTGWWALWRCHQSGQLVPGTALTHHRTVTAGSLSALHWHGRKTSTTHTTGRKKTHQHTLTLLEVYQYYNNITFMRRGWRICLDKMVLLI